jgi:polysaccharide deacetylase family protein (PEP-CTERM system associated)
MLNALTIDVEDYFQVHAFSKVIRYEDWGNYECRIEQNIDRILAILNEATQNSNFKTQNLKEVNSLTHSLNNSFTQKVQGTFFVMGWIAERYPDLIRRIKDEGHEIACHGYAHKVIYRQTKEEFRQDVRKAKALLEDIAGAEVIGYRAPIYSITNKSQWALKILMEEGFKYDSSIFPIHHDFYGFPSAPRFPFIISLNGDSNFEFSMLNFKPQHLSTAAPNNSITPNSIASNLKRSAPQSLNTLLEFPLSTVRFVNMNLPISGGGYFRLLPYRVIELGLMRINRKERKPFIFYFHPWELDMNQPRIKTASPLSKFRHYVNLGRTEDRLKRLLREFAFSTVKEVLEINGHN